MEKEKFLEVAAKGIFLLKRMDEYVDDSTYYLFGENRSLPFLLNEGLIQSYEIDKVVNSIKHCFNLKNNDNDEDGKIYNFYKSIGKDIEPVYNGYITITEKNTIKVILYDDKKFLKNKLDYYFKRYGYINSRIDEEPNNTTSYEYEMKYPEEFQVFQLLLKQNYLYHVTDKKNINNILKRGIKTKSANISYGYMHDERVYLFLEYPSEDNIKTLVISNPVVIKINLVKLPLNYTFYHDPRLNNAVFSYEQISPEAIEVIN